MANYLIRRLLIAGLTLLLVTFVVYGLIRNIPGTAIDVVVANADPSKQIDPADIQRMKEIYGLDKPWYQAYFLWLGNLAKFDLGTSIFHRRGVVEIIGERIGPTLLLSGTSLLLSYFIAVPLGLWSTAHRNQPGERGVSMLLYMLYSLPSFVAALLLQLVFAVWLDNTWLELPLTGIVSDNYESMSFFGKVGDVMWHMILPVTCFTYGSLAYFSRFVKSNMEEVIRQDYIRTARAKGLDQRTIILRHAFPNTMIPFVTLIGLTLPGLLSGSIILETVFNWPGMGLLLYEAIGQRDHEVTMGVVLLYSVLTLGGQLLADVLYAVVDPRVTYS